MHAVLILFEMHFRIFAARRPERWFFAVSYPVVHAWQADFFLRLLLLCANREMRQKVKSAESVKQNAKAAGQRLHYFLHNHLAVKQRHQRRLTCNKQNNDGERTPM